MVTVQNNDEFRQRPTAPESPKTQRAREKLRGQLEAEKARITPKEIEATVERIHKWIADNAKHRVAVKKSSFQLFNHNKNAADLSKKVQSLANRLKSDMKQLAEALDPSQG
ncbi:MAG: hypothetical protein COT85_03345 [Chlamydiae bacterium CG10_big_fil_rev_8_21_14_0_10_42_34]|nr:MAG: hypothetical protein COT85_03345 [Chlamydiae bacterium CG10_big_fil_rev_8_21_14_0_10_42_34]